MYEVLGMKLYLEYYKRQEASSQKMLKTERGSTKQSFLEISL